jgi:hypothetical protein
LVRSLLFSNRCAKIEVKGTKVERSLSKGVPQGGVMSPLCWNIIFDNMLKEINDNAVLGVGFADDACILITGKKPDILMEVIQTKINKIVQWGKSNGLTFSPQKTVAVLFTNKTKIPKLQSLRMDGTTVPLSKEVKYLGITLDSKLNWNPHIKNKICNAKRHLMALKGAIGKRWGPVPDLMCWAYTGIVRPALLYGCHIWAKGCKKKHIIRSFSSLNSLSFDGAG